MNRNEKITEIVKIEIEIPKKALEFAEFYANICNTDTKKLINKAIMERLKTFKSSLKGLPHVKRDEIKERWQFY